MILTILTMDTQDLKGVTLLDILCLFYGVLLGFYIGICKQYNYEQGYSAQHKEMDYQIVKQNISIMTDLNYLDGQNIGN